MAGAYIATLVGQFADLVNTFRPGAAVSAAGVVAAALAAASDPCVALVDRTWADPAAVRACYESFAVNATEKANTMEVTTKMLAFHTSVNYELLAPPPYTLDVHNDIADDLAFINSTTYSSDYALHRDLSRAFRRAQDGHFAYVNYCFDSAFVTYLPTPLVALGDTVYIAPEAFEVATAEFGDEVRFWQLTLPAPLRGKLASLSGAEVLAIDGKDPWAAVDANAAVSGGYQAHGTRQNAFFASYSRGPTGWTYVLGQFAQRALPDRDAVTLTLRRVNATESEDVIIPYRSRIGAGTAPFTDGESFREGNCRAVPGTNGASYYDNVAAATVAANDPALRFAQMAPVNAVDARRHALNVLLDAAPLSNVALPSTLAPGPGLPGSAAVAQFYMLADNRTGVLALGSFAGASFTDLQNATLAGLLTLVARGATRLVVDVTNNGGGYICIAHWLHRIIAGPGASTEPQAGLDTKLRAGPLARKVVAAFAHGSRDPEARTMYHPLNHAFANHTKFPADYDYLAHPVKETINFMPDAFSERLGQECQPFDMAAPAERLFDPRAVAIVSNGRCGSSCSLFSANMAKRSGARTVVLGGRPGVRQAYCGVVGGQSTGFGTIDSEIKTAGLKSDPAAPPDLLTNAVQGITWRLGFGIVSPDEPEEWQAMPADIEMAFTRETVNNPVAIWEAVVKRVF